MFTESYVSGRVCGLAMGYNQGYNKLFTQVSLPMGIFCTKETEVSVRFGVFLVLVLVRVMRAAREAG